MAVAQRLGFQIDKAQTGGRAGVIDNAKILKKWIEEQDSTSLGIVSLSKGSLEFRYAWNFLMNDAEKRKVKIWLNLSGFPHGSSLADHCLSTPKRKLRSQFILWASGLAKAALTETATNFDAWKTPWVLPESVRVMNFVPIPLSSHVQTSLVGRYLSLCRYGPNDGMTDCRRAIYLPGVRLSALGRRSFLSYARHYSHTLQNVFLYQRPLRIFLIRTGVPPSGAMRTSLRAALRFRPQSSSSVRSSRALAT